MTAAPEVRPPALSRHLRTTEQTWHVYMVRCSDNTLYTGVAIDPIKRTNEHNTCNTKGAKYTRPRRPVTLVYREPCPNKSTAYQREYQLKRWSKARKEALLRAYS